jgi:hypothetical protein
MSIGPQKRKVEFLLFVIGGFLAGLLLPGGLCAPQAALATEAFELDKQAGAFERGRQEFQLKRYYAAKAQFMAAVTQNPNNQRAYLYLGLCLEALKEWEDAQATYRACFAVDPFSEDGKRAKRLSMELSGYLESRDHRAVDTAEDVYKAGLRIQRQSFELQTRKLNEAQAYVNNNRGRNRRRGFNYTPYDLTLRQQDDVSNMDFIRNAHDIYDGQTQEARAQAFGLKNAQNVQDSANALIERLGRKTKRSPALRATGTDLYVQYYRTKNDEDDMPPPPDPQIELRAKQMRLSETSSPSALKKSEPPTARASTSPLGDLPMRSNSRNSRHGGALPETDPPATEVGPGVTIYE